jgi:tRNA 2-thiouridine synthesizing protein A
MTDRIAQPNVTGTAAPAADLELDCKGLLCPLPVYRTAQALSRLEAGQVLRVECTDPGSLADFPALARQRKLTLLSAIERDGVQVFHLRKEAGA